MDEITVAIVEDNDTIREGIRELINSSEGFSCSGAYPSAEDAIAGIPEREPDVVLMDIHLPGMSGIECTRHLKHLDPDLRIMMLTVYENDENIFPALEAGASGYLAKRTKHEKLLEAVRDLYNGGSPMSAEIARRVVGRFHEKPAPRNAELETLSPREQEILSYLARGFRYKEIADTLFISLHTVRTHIHKIYEKLHVRNKSEAVLKALKQ